MSTYRLNMADEKLISEVLETDGLVKAVPRLATFFDGIKDMRVEQAQGGGKGAHTGTTGWWKDGNAQYAGTVPLAIKAAVEEIDPGFWNDTKKVLRFFSLHPEYVVSSVVK